MREKADSGAFRGLTDIVPGLCSVLFHYDPVIITAAELKQIVSLHLEQLDLSQQTPHVYGDCRFAMRRICPRPQGCVSKANLTPDEVIALHTSRILEVAIMGFYLVSAI